MRKVRKILHVDINNFFASVEQILDPELKGKPIAVCGDADTRKGIVLAKSEPAKKRGVATGDTIWMAQRKCPDVIIVPGNHEHYSKFSRMAMEIYYRFTDLVESFGSDECWLDVTGSRNLFGSASDIAEKIRKTVKEELGLTVSIGVSFNKVFAKIGSDLKKPDAITIISPDNYKQIFWPLPVSTLLFVGRKTNKMFERLNIKTIGDLANYCPSLLSGFMGINAYKLIQSAKGEDEEAVSPFIDTEEIKSVGNGETAATDILSMRGVRDHIFPICEKIARRMRRKNVKGKTISASIRFSDLHWISAQSTITIPTNSHTTIFEQAMKVLGELLKSSPHMLDAKTPPIRAIRIALSNLSNAGIQQLDLLDDSGEQKKDNISKVLDKINIPKSDAAPAFVKMRKSDKVFESHIEEKKPNKTIIETIEDDFDYID